MSDNPPAFPPAITCTAAGDTYHGYDGMSLRDYYAGQAISGLIASQSVVGSSPAAILKHYADDAFAVADAMLAAREQGK